MTSNVHTLYHLAQRRQNNEALKLVRQYVAAFPAHTHTRHELEKAALRLVKKEHMAREHSLPTRSR